MPNLSWSEVRDRAIRFARAHADDRSERAEKQTFWNEFFEVFGLRRASLASFEANVRNLKGNAGAIDMLWKGRLLVEHKSLGEDLGFATTQAFTYIEDLTRENRWEEIPRYVLISDFAHFVLYDLEPDEQQQDLPLFAGRPLDPHPHSFTLSEFPQHIRSFAFMLGQTHVRLHPDDPANEKAYLRMCELHDSLLAGGFSGHDLERLLVRILFCLFAEDTALFAPDTFTQFIRTQTRDDGADMGAKLNELFDWLNRPEAEGSFDDTDPFFGFRYVNGGLFQERLSFARFNREMREALLFCCDFQWAKISPAVFGSLFQGVMQDRARRQQGAHYTSERDIMKVIRSLFLDELRAKWTNLKANRSTRRRTGVEAFRDELHALQFFDPACGCGNFLVLAYRELRALEIEVVRELAALSGGQQYLPIVDVDQFHGIEYSEWPVRIAEVALWLMDHQMNQQASEVFGESFDRLPLRSSPHIVQDNALRLDWNAVLPRAQCSYVLGNPPFIGKAFRNPEQQADVTLVWEGVRGAGVLDYVTCWYLKAAGYIEGTPIRVGFVSTNSISQGEQVGILWGQLFQRFQLKIHFAHRTFAWESESRGRAHVHVVIVGFGALDVSGKRIFDYDAGAREPTETAATNISPYLVEGPDVAISKRSRPLCQVSEVVYGSMPNDGGHLMLSSVERNELLAEEPGAIAYLRPILGSAEFLNGMSRWCLWLKNAPPDRLRSMPAVMRRIEGVRQHRQNSDRSTTRALAASPALFGEDRQPSARFLAIPKTSSERRQYIPMAFLEPETVANTELQMIADATDYEFGVLTSGMHMAWVRIVAGRLESRYRYSNTLVYNNFPWPSPTPAQRARVEENALAVLAAREPHLPPGGMSTLADLYDPLTMPVALGKAHAELDRAVERCYRAEAFHSDRERVEFLFRLYDQLTAPLLPTTSTARRARAHRR